MPCRRDGFKTRGADYRLQKGSVIFLGAFLGTVLVYQFRPQESDNWTVSNLLTKYRSKAEHWEAINSLHTKAMEQAGFDRNLFENGSSKHRFVDVAYPEYASFAFFLYYQTMSFHWLINSPQSSPIPRCAKHSSRPPRQHRSCCGALQATASEGGGEEGGQVGCRQEGRVVAVLQYIQFIEQSL